MLYNMINIASNFEINMIYSKTKHSCILILNLTLLNK